MTERPVISALAFEAEMQNVTRTLARDGGLKVVIGGDQAFTDGNTVVLPGVDRTKEIDLFDARVARGYVDHEAAHNRETDFDGGWLEKAKDHSKFAEAMLQGIEDVRIDKIQTDRYQGSRTNIEATTQATVDLFLERAKAGQIKHDTPEAQHGLLPFATAVAGRKLMNLGLQHVDEVEKMCGPAVWNMAVALANRALTAKSTGDAYQLAMWAVNNPPDPKNPNPPPPPQSGQGNGQSDGQGQGSGSGSGGGDGKGGKGEGVGKQAGGTGGGGGGHYDNEMPEPQIVDFADAVNKRMGGDAGSTTKGVTEYRSDWSLDNFISQKVQKFGDGQGRASNRYLLKTDANSHADYRAAKLEIGAQIGAIKMAFERYLMSMTSRGWEGGMHEGNLDPRRLSAAVAGSTTVFRQRDERVEIDTAVSILVDMSGSMSGVAPFAAKVVIALSEALNKVNIPFEITAHATGGTNFASGFSTKQDWDRLPKDHVARRVGIPKFQSDGSWRGHWEVLHLTRWVRQDFYVLKAFNETLFASEGPIVGLAAMAHGGTVEADGVLKTYERLRRRPERRKVLMSICDGGPGGGGPGDEGQHLRNTVELLSKDKSLHLMAIGIGTDAPKAYYRNATVIHDIKEMPRTIFGKMKEALVVRKAA